MVPLAGVLSQCLGSRSADDASRLVQPIVRAVTKAAQERAKPEEGSPPADAGPDKVSLDTSIKFSMHLAIFSAAVSACPKMY